jgi:hypothetical protein
VIAGDDVRWIELKVAEMFDRLEDRPSAWPGRAVEELRVDREAARLGEREFYAELPSARQAIKELARGAILASMRPEPAGVSPGRARGSSR